MEWTNVFALKEMRLYHHQLGSVRVCRCECVCVCDCDKPQNWCCDNKLHHRLSDVGFLATVLPFILPLKLALKRQTLSISHLAKFSLQKVQLKPAYIYKAYIKYALTWLKRNGHYSFDREFVFYSSQHFYDSLKTTY